MKELKIKQRFIGMRTKGISFDSISRELGVSKTTLIKWSKKLHLEIHNLRAIEYSTLLESCKLAKQHRIKGLAKIITKIEKEIEKRELGDVPIEKLVDMQIKLLNRVDGELSNEDISIMEETRDLIPMLEPRTSSYKID